MQSTAHHSSPFPICFGIAQLGLSLGQKSKHIHSLAALRICHSTFRFKPCTVHASRLVVLDFRVANEEPFLFDQYPYYSWYLTAKTNIRRSRTRVYCTFSIVKFAREAVDTHLQCAGLWSLKMIKNGGFSKDGPKCGTIYVECIYPSIPFSSLRRGS